MFQEKNQVDFFGRIFSATLQNEDDWQTLWGETKGRDERHRVSNHNKLDKLLQNQKIFSHLNEFIIFLLYSDLVHLLLSYISSISNFYILHFYGGKEYIVLR